jgi:hypothetical protein
MNYTNGFALDTYGNSRTRTLGSIESQRLAQAYLRLTDAYRLAESPSPRSSAIDAKARSIARALAVSVC